MLRRKLAALGLAGLLVFGAVACASGGGDEEATEEAS
jgi:hypothetical protein